MYKILIIDNSTTIPASLIQGLSKSVQGLHIHRTNEFSNALNILEKEKIDVIIIDNSISRRNKVFLKQLQQNKQQPLIMTVINETDNKSRDLPEAKINKPSSPATNSAIMVSTAIGVCPVLPDTVLAVEKTQRNRLNIYTSKRVLKEVRGSINEMFGLFPENFVFINRHCFINRMAITRIIPKTKEIFLDINNNEEPFLCSRDKMKEIIVWFDASKKRHKIRRA